MAELRTRRPNEIATWHQRALLSYEPGTYPERMIAALTADSRLAASYWLEAGQDVNADLYAQEPGADYDVICHDGTWLDMYEQVCAAWEEARDAAEAGYPSALIITSLSGIDAMLNDAADRLARRQHAAVLAARGLEPAMAYASEAHVEIHADVWKVMSRRRQQLMAKVLTWPGPVVMTARETRSPDGQWQLRANDQVGFDITAWIRLTRDEPPEIVSLDTAEHYRMTRSERAALRPQFTLARLIFDWARCNATTRAPEPRVFDADQVMPGEQPARMLHAVKSVRTTPQSRARASVPRPAASNEPASDGKTLPSEDERLAHFTDAWLDLSQRNKVQPLWERMNADLSEEALARDIKGWLTEQDRAQLGIADGEAYSLKALANQANDHVYKTGTTVTGRSPVGAAS